MLLTLTSIRMTNTFKSKNKKSSRLLWIITHKLKWSVPKSYTDLDWYFLKSRPHSRIKYLRYVVFVCAISVNILVIRLPYKHQVLSQIHAFFAKLRGFITTQAGCYVLQARFKSHITFCNENLCPFNTVILLIIRILILINIQVCTIQFSKSDQICPVTEIIYYTYWRTVHVLQ